MAIQVIVSQPGPLPITANFSAPSDDPMYLEVNGSVWCSTANELIGIDVALDGNVLGTAQIYSNEPSSHRAVVPAYLEVQLTEGQHVLTLSQASNTVSDYNDVYTVVLHY